MKKIIIFVFYYWVCNITTINGQSCANKLDSINLENINLCIDSFNLTQNHSYIKRCQKLIYINLELFPQTNSLNCTRENTLRYFQIAAKLSSLPDYSNNLFEKQLVINTLYKNLGCLDSFIIRKGKRNQYPDVETIKNTTCYEPYKELLLQEQKMKMEKENELILRTTFVYTIAHLVHLLSIKNEIKNMDTILSKEIVDNFFTKNKGEVIFKQGLYSFLKKELLSKDKTLLDYLKYYYTLSETLSRDMPK